MGNSEDLLGRGTSVGAELLLLHFLVLCQDPEGGDSSRIREVEIMRCVPVDCTRMMMRDESFYFNTIK
jgi:hypothetical protein